MPSTEILTQMPANILIDSKLTVIDEPELVTAIVEELVVIVIGYLQIPIF